MIIAKAGSTFLYRSFFVRGSRRKTFHEEAEDGECKYSEVWRLAPRNELRRKDPRNARKGETSRFLYNDKVLLLLS